MCCAKGRRTAPILTHVVLAAGLALVTTSARAQPFERPGDVRPELPPLEEPRTKPELELPPIPERPPPERAPLSMQLRITVREFRVTGSTVFSEEELAEITEPYTNRPITGEELQELRDALTLRYVNEGYLNSGAVLPDQDASDGVVEFRIVEGNLTRIQLEGNRWFRDGYLRSRLERGAGTPLNVRSLEERLQILQQDSRIRRLNAELRPGELPGEAALRLRVEEELPFRISWEGSNHEPPSIGSYRSRLQLADENLTGYGDILRARVDLTEGLRVYEGRYEVPLNSFDTTLGFRYHYGTADVVERPFDELDIESKSQTVGIELRHPLHRSLRSRLDLSLIGEYRTSETFLLGQPFSFAPGPEEGESKVIVVRFGQEWLFRDLSQVFAVRSLVSVGLDAFGATMHGGDVPDGQFLAWLGQFQWARRFDPWGMELIFRTDLQVSSSPLLSLEQFAMGGARSVRGYRERRLVRDNGVVSSVELRIPLWREATGRSLVQLAPFFDFGRSWYTRRDEFEPETIYSAGVGLRCSFTRHLHGEIYWAKALRDVLTFDDDDLQDEGVHFRVVLAY